MSEELIYVQIEVVALVPKRKLGQDAGIPGFYGYCFLGSEAPDLTAEQIGEGYDRFTEHALDWFHDHFGIECLEYFEITPKRLQSVLDFEDGVDVELSAKAIFAQSQSKPKI